MASWEGVKREYMRLRDGSVLPRARSIWVAWTSGEEVYGLCLPVGPRVMDPCLLFWQCCSVLARKIVICLERLTYKVLAWKGSYR